MLHEAGYELEEQPTRPHPDQVRSFERAKPNQLWQTDLFTFVLKRQNRRVYLVAFMDDHSRFIVGYGLHASQSTPLVLEVLRAAIAAYGAPEEILTDNGTQYVTWRGKSQFTKELEKRGIKQIVAKPQAAADARQDRALLGDAVAGVRRERRCSSTWTMRGGGSACSSTTTTSSASHPGIDGLVPADRFFQAAPEVLATLKERVAANALGAGAARRAQAAVLPDGPGRREALQRASGGRAGDPAAGGPGALGDRTGAAGRGSAGRVGTAAGAGLSARHPDAVRRAAGRAAAGRLGAG